MKRDTMDRELRKQLLRLEAQQHRLRLGEEFKALRESPHTAASGSLWQTLGSESFTALIANLLPGRWGRVAGVAVAALRLARRWTASRKKASAPDAPAPTGAEGVARP